MNKKVKDLVPVETLIEKMKKHLPSFDEDLLRKAYAYGLEKHGNQMRHSGDLYFSHPIAVAEILIDQHLDLDTVVTALLHDVLEDTPVTAEEMEKEFGASITFLVKGVTKLAKVKLRSDKQDQAENFRKFILAVAEDLRVLIVKLADRLHNMQTLEFHPDPKRRERKALEVMEIYVPLADRIGMNSIKDQLEILAFKHLEPESYHTIQEELKTIRVEGQDLIEPIIDELKELALEHTIKALVVGREKSPPSIYRKMQRKGISFDRIFDIMAFRYITKNVTDCYRLLGLIHEKYAMVPGRFKDYISTPKPNGYQSIHTTIIGPHAMRIEIQIRTEEMHEIAQFGIAAHWAYKEGIAEHIQQGPKVFFNRLVESLQNAQSIDEFLEYTKLDAYRDSIFCFSPKGDLIPLPYEATPLDFAYEIHSDLGNQCIGAKVNRKIVSISTPLKTGDQVEILTSRSQEPQPEWLDFIVSSKSKSHIQRFLRQKQSGETTRLGRQMMKFVFQEHGLTWNEKALIRLLPTLNAKTLEEVYRQVGRGEKTPESILFALYPEKKEKILKKVVFEDLVDSSEKQSPALDIPIEFAKCCHPLVGDPIKGLLHTGAGMTVHKATCSHVQRLETDERNNIKQLRWDHIMREDLLLIGRIKVVCHHRQGALHEITKVMAENDIQMHDIRVMSRSVDYVEFLLDVEVQTRESFQQLIENLRALPRISSVDKV